MSLKERLDGGVGDGGVAVDVKESVWERALIGVVLGGGGDGGSEPLKGGEPGLEDGAAGPGSKLRAVAVVGDELLVVEVVGGEGEAHGEESVDGVVRCVVGRGGGMIPVVPMGTRAIEDEVAPGVDGEVLGEPAKVGRVVVEEVGEELADVGVLISEGVEGVGFRLPAAVLSVL